MSKIVVLNTDGVVIDVEPFNGRSDAGRDRRVAEAIQSIQARIGGSAPEMLRSRDFADSDGRVWFRTIADNIQVGMVEIGFGQFGFPARGI